MGRGVGVDPVGLVDFCDFIYSGDCNAVSKTQVKEGLTFPQFIELILELGGTNNCRVKDIIDLRKVLLLRFATLDDAVRDQAAFMERQAALMEQLLPVNQAIARIEQLIPSLCQRALRLEVPSVDARDSSRASLDASISAQFAL